MAMEHKSLPQRRKLNRDASLSWGKGGEEQKRELQRMRYRRLQGFSLLLVVLPPNQTQSTRMSRNQMGHLHRQVHSSSHLVRHPKHQRSKKKPMAPVHHQVDSSFHLVTAPKNLLRNQQPPPTMADSNSHSAKVPRNLPRQRPQKSKTLLRQDLDSHLHLQKSLMRPRRMVLLKRRTTRSPPQQRHLNSPLIRAPLPPPLPPPSRMNPLLLHPPRAGTFHLLQPKSSMRKRKMLPPQETPRRPKPPPHGILEVLPLAHPLRPQLPPPKQQTLPQLNNIIHLLAP
mmetsp:Transcript_3704/g.14094  ORF Transcript_3704/g.14094 Transcript_3704/m.14094 type:complete len:284 (+) Transcript_3704:219-1070(+)